MNQHSPIGATRPFSLSDRVATEAPAAVPHDPEQSVGAIRRQPTLEEREQVSRLMRRYRDRDRSNSDGKPEWSGDLATLEAEQVEA